MRQALGVGPQACALQQNEVNLMNERPVGAHGTVTTLRATPPYKMLSQDTSPSKHTENELLLCCAHTHPDAKTVERLETLLPQDLNWQRLIQTASKNGVLPLLYRSLSRSFPDAVPKIILAQLRESSRSNVQNSLLLTAELLKLVELFAVYGVNRVATGFQLMRPAIRWEV